VTEFVFMGGYAGYVWSAYGITLAVMIANVWAAYRYHAKWRERALEEGMAKISGRQPRVKKIS
jgi:heme exporter protein D